MPSKVHALHILVKTEQEALGLLYDLRQGKEFSELAKQKSLCPSKRDGGDLGWFGRGQMVREFEQAAFGLQPGEVSKPVKTPFGWHIIKLIESK